MKLTTQQLREAFQQTQREILAEQQPHETRWERMAQLLNEKMTIPNWPTILDIVETGIEGDKEKCRGYAELWLEKLQADGETRIAQSLQHVLEGRKGQVIHLANETNEHSP